MSYKRPYDWSNPSSQPPLSSKWQGAGSRPQSTSEDNQPNELNPARSRRAGDPQPPTIRSTNLPPKKKAKIWGRPSGGPSPYFGVQGAQSNRGSVIPRGTFHTQSRGNTFARGNGIRLPRGTAVNHRPAPSSSSVDDHRPAGNPTSLPENWIRSRTIEEFSGRGKPSPLRTEHASHDQLNTVSGSRIQQYPGRRRDPVLNEALYGAELSLPAPHLQHLPSCTILPSIIDVDVAQAEKAAPVNEVPDDQAAGFGTDDENSVAADHALISGRLDGEDEEEVDVDDMPEPRYLSDAQLYFPDLVAPPSPPALGFHPPHSTFHEPVVKREPSPVPVNLSADKQPSHGTLFIPMRPECATRAAAPPVVKARRNVWYREEKERLASVGRAVTHVVIRGDGMALDWIKDNSLLPIAPKLDVLEELARFETGQWGDEPPDQQAGLSRGQTSTGPAVPPIDANASDISHLIKPEPISPRPMIGSIPGSSRPSPSRSPSPARSPSPIHLDAAEWGDIPLFQDVSSSCARTAPPGDAPYLKYGTKGRPSQVSAPISSSVPAPVLLATSVAFVASDTMMEGVPLQSSSQSQGSGEVSLIPQGTLSEHIGVPSRSGITLSTRKARSSPPNSTNPAPLPAMPRPQYPLPQNPLKRTWLQMSVPRTPHAQLGTAGRPQQQQASVAREPPQKFLNRLSEGVTAPVSAPRTERVALDVAILTDHVSSRNQQSSAASRLKDEERKAKVKFDRLLRTSVWNIDSFGERGFNQAETESKEEFARDTSRNKDEGQGNGRVNVDHLPEAGRIRFSSQIPHDSEMLREEDLGAPSDDKSFSQTNEVVERIEPHVCPPDTPSGPHLTVNYKSNGAQTEFDSLVGQVEKAAVAEEDVDDAELTQLLELQGKGRAQIHQFSVEEGRFIDPTVRLLARKYQWFLPEAATTSRAVSVYFLTDDAGNTSCLYHSRANKEGQLDKLAFTGQQNQTSGKARLEGTYMDCGCDEEAVLMEWIWWKTWLAKRPTGESEGLRLDDLPNPRFRWFSVQAWKSRAKIQLDDHWVSEAHTVSHEDELAAELVRLEKQMDRVKETMRNARLGRVLPRGLIYYG